MQRFLSHTGIGVPLRRSNVDTDQLVPSRFLKRITRTGFDDALFFEWRRDDDFVLNRQPYAKGTVLVAGPDFGTGSSREHAGWALWDFGFRVVLSSRFADIFRGNAGKRGLVTAQLPQPDIERIWAALEESPGTTVTVDLENRIVRCATIEVPFEVDDYTRWRLLEGLDDIDLTLRHDDEIAAFEDRRPAWLPEVSSRPPQAHTADASTTGDS